MALHIHPIKPMMLINDDILAMYCSPTRWLHLVLIVDGDHMIIQSITEGRTDCGLITVDSITQL